MSPTPRTALRAPQKTWCTRSGTRRAPSRTPLSALCRVWVLPVPSLRNVHTWASQCHSRPQSTNTHQTSPTHPERQLLRLQACAPPFARCAVVEILFIEQHPLSDRDQQFRGSDPSGWWWWWSRRRARREGSCWREHAGGVRDDGAGRKGATCGAKSGRCSPSSAARSGSETESGGVGVEGREVADRAGHRPRPGTAHPCQWGTVCQDPPMGEVDAVVV